MIPTLRGRELINFNDLINSLLVWVRYKKFIAGFRDRLNGWVYIQSAHLLSNLKIINPLYINRCGFSLLEVKANLINHYSVQNSHSHDG